MFIQIFFKAGILNKLNDKRDEKLNDLIFKQCKEELDELKRKNERLNNEKNELKLLNNQLENKVTIFLCEDIKISQVYF